MGVVRELCADLILGQDFLKRHKSATFLMGRPLKAIEAKQCNTCGVAAADIHPPHLFQFFDPKIRPTPPGDLIWLTYSLLGRK